MLTRECDIAKEGGGEDTPKRVKILVAEDDPVTCRLLTRDLSKWGYVVVALDNGEDALAALRDPSMGIELAILDWMMPKMDGTAVCRALRQAPPEHYVYVILLSGKELKQDIVEGLDAGADDYLAKPYNPQELLSRIRAAERIIQLQAALQLANVRLQRLAATDFLTGLMNRQAIEERLSGEVSRSGRGRSPLGVALLDIDHFKRINDTLGHAAGDAVLQEFARRLVATLRDYDSVGRYGGEEFLLVCPDVARAGLAEVLERARTAIASVPFDTGAGMHTVTASFGACWVPLGAPNGLTGLLAEVDRLLYQAKEAGRNRVVAGDYPGTPGRESGPPVAE